MEQVKPVKIEATVMWAFLNRRNDMSGKYQVDLCNLSDKDAQALHSLGIEVKENDNKPEKGKYITCKSANYEIDAFDTHGDRLDGDVGNGSKCKALIGVYNWTFKNKKGVSPSLKKLVITDLVRFQPDEQAEADMTL
jgi:hypothetical protein